jgi:tetratricopeptide (TPR) repeat protein
MNVPLSQRALGIPVHVWCAVVVVLCAATVSAQEPLTKAKALYDAARYEEALTVLAPVHEPEAQQYRALCMLALGRAQDASGEVDSLIASAPTFEPSAEDVPPRFVSLVSETKKRLLPSIARKTFAEAREQFKSGDRAEALKKFELVVTLASVGAFKDTSDADDLRTLASGFIELARASAPIRPAPTTPVPAPESPKVAEATPAAPPVSTPAAAKAPAKATSPLPSATALQASSDVSQPVAVRQTIPAIPSSISGQGSPTASVKVEIGTDGHVVNASMQKSAHPLYDRLVLQFAREWLYTPAMLNGRPVPSEKVVTIQLR